MKNNEIHLINEVELVLKNYCIFGFLWLIFGFSPDYIFSYYDSNIDSILFSFLNTVILYCIFLFGFVLCAFSARKSYDSFNSYNLSKIVYFLLFLYYFILILRYYFFDLDNIYGFRLFIGFIFPFWILCPLFIFNVRFKFNLFLCIFCCLLEVVFWCLFYSVYNADNKEILLPSYAAFSTIISVALFPLFLIFLGRIGAFNIVKKTKIIRIRLISKIISSVVVILGGFFMFFLPVFLIF